MWFSRIFWRTWLLFGGLHLATALAFVAILTIWHERQLLDQSRLALHDLAAAALDELTETLAAGPTAGLDAFTRTGLPKRGMCGSP